MSFIKRNKLLKISHRIAEDKKYKTSLSEEGSALFGSMLHDAYGVRRLAPRPRRLKRFFALETAVRETKSLYSKKEASLRAHMASCEGGPAQAPPLGGLFASSAKKQPVREREREKNSKNFLNF